MVIAALLGILIFNSPPVQGPRVVSLSPAVTEIIYAIGRGDLLVGNTIYCDYPEEAKEVRKVGDLISPKIELIKSLRPDFVFLTLPLQRHVKEELSALGIETVDVSPESISGIYEAIMKVGRLLGAKMKAESLVAELKSTVDSLRNSRSEWRPRCYVELSSDPPYTVGGTSFVNELLEVAGGVNIFSDVKKSYFVVSLETVVERNPEVIILIYEGASREDVLGRLGFEKVEAVKRGWIITGLDPDLLTRPGPRFVEGIKALREAILSLESNRKSRP